MRALCCLALCVSCASPPQVPPPDGIKLRAPHGESVAPTATQAGAHSGNSSSAAFTVGATVVYPETYTGLDSGVPFIVDDAGTVHF